ncbi:MAG: hypothetical protein ACI89X_003581 [Planctomycetota bacterium]|jgi:hypothetical protein
MTDKDLQEQMAQFEAARITAPVELSPQVVGKIVAVHDGTDQDATVDALAGAMAKRAAVELQTISPQVGDEDAVLAELLAAAGKGDVLVVPCPFGRDYLAEGQLSLSTTIDLLLAKSEAAICIARGPVEDAEHTITHPLVALQIDRHRKVQATSLALTFAKDGGEILLLSTVDPHNSLRDEEMLARNLDPRDLSPEVLSGLATARAAALTAELQRHAGDWDISPMVHFALGDTVELTLEENENRMGMLVVGRDPDARNDEAQRARRLVLASSFPVLLV